MIKKFLVLLVSLLTLALSVLPAYAAAPPTPTVSISSPSNITITLGQSFTISGTGTKCHHICGFVNGSAQITQNGNYYSTTYKPSAAGTYSVYIAGRNTANSTDAGTKLATSVTRTVTVTQAHSVKITASNSANGINQAYTADGSKYSIQVYSDTLPTNISLSATDNGSAISVSPSTIGLTSQSSGKGYSATTAYGSLTFSITIVQRAVTTATVKWHTDHMHVYQVKDCNTQAISNINFNLNVDSGANAVIDDITLGNMVPNVAAGHKYQLFYSRVIAITVNGVNQSPLRDCHVQSDVNYLKFTFPSESSFSNYDGLYSYWNAPVPTPSVSLSSPTNGTNITLGQSITIAGSGANCDHICDFINGTAQVVQTGNSYSRSYTPTAVGSYTVFLRGRNAPNDTDVGTKTADSQTYTFTVTTPPVDLTASIQTWGDVRTNTDVIFNVVVSNSGDTDILPLNNAIVSFTACGTTQTAQFVVPRNSTQTIPFKVHTPSSAGTITFAAVVDSTNAIVERNESNNTATKSVNAYTPVIPDIPDPQETDTKPSGWHVPSVPQTIADKHTTWNEWRYNTSSKSFTNTQFYVDTSTTFSINPDPKISSTKYVSGAYIIKSGYGVEAYMTVNVSTNYDRSGIITPAQRVWAYTPESGYSLFRDMDLTISGLTASAKLKPNKYSTYNARLNFTPIWYADGYYTIYGKAMDIWTPTGEVNIGYSSHVTISGNLYDDWHIGPQN